MGQANIMKNLDGFDEYIDRVIEEWNAPGIAVGVVVKDKLEYSRGFGYRDIENKLPVTCNTLFPIASNTKLFTAVVMGMLVEDGKLEWDKPISQYVSDIRFYNQELYNTVTLRDMLAHRTGISRHDFIWYKSSFSRKELFDRLKYLEPVQPVRQSGLYNNLMYAAAGYCLELLTGKTWEETVQERILDPLEMNKTLFTIEDMERQTDFAYPYYEDRETEKLLKRPYYREQQGIGPAGAIISDLEDMSRWVVALMNGGQYDGRSVISPDILKETLQPGIAYPNVALETRGYDEILNSVYGMGRSVEIYKGHYFTRHGGSIGGFYSQVSLMPYDGLGVIVFVNGEHNLPLVNTVSYNIYDRLLGLEQTDFNARSLKDYMEGKEAAKEARKSAGGDRVSDTEPSHSLAEYQGQYEDPAYGLLNIGLNGGQLVFDLHNIVLPLEHYHYDRFDTPDDQVYGKYTVNFFADPRGEISKAVISLDESEVAFVKKPDGMLSEPGIIARYVGVYERASQVIEVITKDKIKLVVRIPGQPDYTLVPYKKNKFTFNEFSDYTVEFTVVGTEVKTMKLSSPVGTYELKRK